MSAQPSEGKRRLHWLPIVAWSIVVVLVAVFILQNTRSGKVDFLVWDIHAPAWAWLVRIFCLWGPHRLVREVPATLA
jgi:uncharacterized integral membrane protein